MTVTMPRAAQSILQTHLYNHEHAANEMDTALKEARDETQRWIDTCRDLETQRDDYERRWREGNQEAQRQVNEARWASVQQKTEYEERIAALERLVEAERRMHAADLERQTELLRQTQADAEARVREAERRHESARCAADARAVEAEERADLARLRAEQEVALSRQREEQRVQEVRQKAEARLKEVEEQKRFELSQIGARVVDRQRAMEETLFTNGRKKSEAVSEAHRQAGLLEKEMRELLAAREVEVHVQAARSGEILATERQQHDAAAGNHSKIIELERALHQRTIERMFARGGGGGGVNLPPRAAGAEVTYGMVASKGLPPSLPQSSPLARAGAGAVRPSPREGSCA
eukprot:TRINITY_DN31277_c0_g2_i1.p1 TRINITY_DN31277_c0_g2~~TRINITY_DN31277_c0_g2_i1.p1  ORF type:complete len:350 (-),score=94.96 TRINITY_DN31277_c0_g2_i1:57-1106(-)